MIKKIAATIFGLIFLFAALKFVHYVNTDYKDCINDPNRDNNDCFLHATEEIPQVKEARSWEQACNDTGTDCGMKIAGEVAKSKLTE